MLSCHWRRAGFEFAGVCVLAALVGACTSRHAGLSGTNDAGVDRAGGDVVGGSGAGGTGTRNDGAAASGDARMDGGAPGPGAGGDGAGHGGGAGTGGAPSGGSDAAAGGDSATGDAGFGAGCNTLMPAGPVDVMCAGDAGAPPTSAGGTLVAGIYRLTAVTAYGPCTAFSVSQSLQLTATTLQLAVADPFTGTSRANATYTVSGTNLVQTNTCPDTTARTLGYTSVTAAGVTTLTLITTDSGTTTVATMTRP
jgi:hypothetical protein